MAYGRKPTPANITRRPWYKTDITGRDEDFQLWYSHHEGVICREVGRNSKNQPILSEVAKFTYRRDDYTVEGQYNHWFVWNVDPETVDPAVRRAVAGFYKRQHAGVDRLANSDIKSNHESSSRYKKQRAKLVERHGMVAAG